MIQVCKISPENGLFVEDVIIESFPVLEDGTIDPVYINIPVPSNAGFYCPRWDGEKWVEGRTPEEIAAILAAAQEHELTDIEKLKIRQDATENAVLFLMDMGGML